MKDILTRLLALPKKLWQNLIGSFKKLNLIEKIALIFIFFYYLFYTFIPLKEPFQTILPFENIDSLTLCLEQSPQKINENYFIMKAKVLEVAMKKNSLYFTGKAKGRIEVLVPASLVEALYPGKLFSISSSIAIFETGSILKCTGSFLNEKNEKHKTKSYKTFYISNAEQKAWKSKLSETRALLRLAFKRLLYSWASGGGLILALLSGERLYLDTSLSIAFRNAGLSHVLALSGMHLSFFSGFIAGLATKICGKKRSPLFSFIAISFFVWFAGFSPSLLRAYISAIIGLISSYACIKIDLKSILSLSFIVQILISPYDGMSLSFLLSYGALLGIALFSSFFFTKLIRFLPEPLALSISASIAAQIATTPFTLFFFGTITPIGILATLVISPLISLFMTLAIFAIIMALIFPQTMFFSGILIKGLYSLIAFLVLWFARVPLIQF